MLTSLMWLFVFVVIVVNPPVRKAGIIIYMFTVKAIVVSLVVYIGFVLIDVLILSVVCIDEFFRLQSRCWRVGLFYRLCRHCCCACTYCSHGEGEHTHRLFRSRRYCIWHLYCRWLRLSSCCKWRIYVLNGFYRFSSRFVAVFRQSKISVRSFPSLQTMLKARYCNNVKLFV